MMCRIRWVLCALAVAGAPVATWAQTACDSIAVDTVAVKHKNLIDKVIGYFSETNKVKDDKPFDISFIGGPHYSSETSVGLGLIAAGQYKTDRADTTLQYSNVALKFDISVNGLYEIGASGTQIQPRDRARWNYDFTFFSQKTYWWGIGYDMDSDDANETKYKRFEAKFVTDYVWRLLPAFYLGPQVELNYVSRRDHGPEAADMALWGWQPYTTFNWAPGLTAYIDTRDNLTAPTRGVHARVDQRFYLRGLGNKHAFSLTEARVAVYSSLWRGAVLATMAHGRFTYGNTPWGLLSTFGGSHYMRGYYEGRFVDKCVMDATVELRQHVWRRNGIVVWGGLGTVFPDFAAIRWRQVLPNCGLGYRWEFKKHSNVRLDIGFGRHTKGVVFNINEAF